MIQFTDKRLYLKGTSEAICTDKVTGDIVYFSNKFQSGNVTTSVTMGEIRAVLATLLRRSSRLMRRSTWSLWRRTSRCLQSLHSSAQRSSILRPL